MREKHENENKNKYIKELDIQFQTAQKDARISQLQVEKKKENQIRILIISISIFIVVLLIIFLLYNRIKRLRKEKEAGELTNRIQEKDNEFQLAQIKYESEKSRSYINGLETERNRLSKELHDNVANSLLAIDMQLQKNGNIPDTILENIENLHIEVRNISHELMPPMFRYAVMLEIISDYVAKVNEAGNIKFELVCNNEEALSKLSHETNLEIYRIIQEATSNIIKHSGAKEASIIMNANTDLFHLTIQDNGTGFEPGSKQTGVGLQIIRERVAKLGGKINIDPAKDKGCIIKIEIPISQSTP